MEISDEEAAAAYAGKLFARWGSEVIKVETPRRPPPDEADDLYVNAGKQRVNVDYRSVEGRKKLERLATACDIVVTDAPAAEVGELQLLELGGCSGAPVRTSITPFGLSGPYATFKANDATLLALAGHTFLIGDPGRAPLGLPGHHATYLAGTFAFTASLAAALHSISEDGCGPYKIELSVLECLMGLHHHTDTQWIENHYVFRRLVNSSDMSVSTMLACRDGWFGFAPTQEFWMPFALMLGRSDLIEGHVLSTLAGRIEHREEFESLVRTALADRSKHEIFVEGQETWRVPVGYMATLADCLADRHLEARGFWRPLDGVASAAGVLVRTPGSPFRFVGEPRPEELGVRRPGADTAELPSGPQPPAPPGRDSRARTAASGKPLEGMRVLDLTRVWSGPLAARILADLGAEVICIEAPTGRGPATVPPGSRAYAQGGQIAEPWNQQLRFNKLHRNRQSVCLDLKSARGRDLFLQLAGKSDVIVDNFSARAMSRLGLGYEELRAANEGIIYLAMPAFGIEGPYRDYVGFGSALEPMTGLAAVMGYSEDAPRTTGSSLPDPIAGVTAAAAVVTALERRQRTGHGCHIDLSQHEAEIVLLGEYFLERQLSGHEPPYLVNGSRSVAPHGVYRCQGEDEWLALAARDDDEWSALCRIAGQPWASDTRFATPGDRLQHRVELDGEISAWTGMCDKFSLMTELLQAGVPAGAVLSPPEFVRDPHLIARGYFADLATPDPSGRRYYDGSPFIVNGTRGYESWVPAPKLGEHNEAVLGGLLGLDSRELSALLAEGVLASRPPV